MKSLSYGNAKSLSVGYNNHLQATTYEVPGVLKKAYQYHDDGRLKSTQDQLTANSKFDRSYEYDHVGRVRKALSGAEARGGAATDDRPYNETLSYDAMGHLTALERRHWDRWDGSGPRPATNNRFMGFTYDADGRVTGADTGGCTYDAAGRVVMFGDSDPFQTDQQFTGDGLRAKTTARRFDSVFDTWVTEKVTYYITSTVLGGKLVTELSAQGTKERTLVYAGGSVLASQVVTGGNSAVAWEHWDSSGASQRPTNSSGQIVGGLEVDPVGANAGLLKPPDWNVADKKGLPVPFPEVADMLENPGGACVADGMAIPCHMLTANNSAECPQGTCKGLEYNLATQQLEWRFFQAFANGYVGYVPTGATSSGSGGITLRNGDEGWGYLGESWASSLPQNTGFDVPGITNLVNQELADPDCAKFAETILNQLSKGRGGSLADVFKAFLNQSKSHDLFTRTAPPGSRGEATAIGNLKDSTASMFLRRDPNQMRQDANGVIAELFHFAGRRYDDEKLAKALNQTIYEKEASLAFPDGTANIFDRVNYRPNGWSDADGYSTYFHAIQQRHCGTIPPNTYRNR